MRDCGKGKEMGAQEFHVVAPSLPGFGFSAAPRKKGFGILEMAKTVNDLMLKLGYRKYVAQGEGAPCSARLHRFFSCSSPPSHVGLNWEVFRSVPCSLPGHSGPGGSMCKCQDPGSHNQSSSPASSCRDPSSLHRFGSYDPSS